MVAVQARSHTTKKDRKLRYAERRKRLMCGIQGVRSHTPSWQTCFLTLFVDPDTPIACETCPLSIIQNLSPTDEQHRLFLEWTSYPSSSLQDAKQS